MMSSVARPLAVARGGHSQLGRYRGKEHGDDPISQFRHQAPRCVVGWESEKLRDALSEKASRCVVGPHLQLSPRGWNPDLTPHYDDGVMSGVLLPRTVSGQRRTPMSKTRRSRSKTAGLLALTVTASLTVLVGSLASP